MDQDARILRTARGLRIAETVAALKLQLSTEQAAALMAQAGFKPVEEIKLKLFTDSGSSVTVSTKRRRPQRTAAPTGQLTPVPPSPQYPPGFLARYC